MKSPTRFPLRRLTSSAVLTVVTLLPFVPDRGVAETSVEVGIRLANTDNRDLTEENEQSDLARSPYIAAEWSRETRSLTASIDANLEYQDYREDTTPDNTLGDLSAIAAFHLIENRLDFNVENRFQQVLFDELDPQTPENVENVNTFVMGPDLIFDPSPVDRLTFGARYGNTYFERGNDSERWALGAIWSHRLDPLNEISVSAQSQDVQFTEFSGNPLDYTIDEVGLGGTRRLVRGEISLTGGQRRIEQDGGDTLERGFARFDWNYTPTRRTEFELRAETGLTDSGVRILGRNTPSVELPAGDAFNSDDILTLSEVQARLVRRGGRADVILGGLVTDEDFATSNLDRERYGANLAIDYPLSPVDRLSWTLRGERIDYLLINRRDDDVLTGISLRHLLGPNTFVEAGYRYWQRDSSEDGASFEENRTFLAVGYRWGD